MRQATVFSLVLLLCLSLGAGAQQTSAPVAPGSLATPASTPAGSADSDLINQLLTLLDGAVITKLDAKVSLESFKVESGRVRLKGVLLKNFELGLRLNADGTQRLIKIMQQHYAGDANAAQPNQWSQILQILKLGIFNRIEVTVRLRELKARWIALDADRLQIEGSLLQIGATPNDPITGKPKSDTLQTLMNFLKRTALNRVKIHAGLDHLAARRLRLKLDGAALQGFSVGLALQRQQDVAP